MYYSQDENLGYSRPHKGLLKSGHGVTASGCTTGILIDRKNLRCYPRPPESESSFYQDPQVTSMHFKVWKALLYPVAPDDETYCLDFSKIWLKFCIQGNPLHLRLRQLVPQPSPTKAQLVTTINAARCHLSGPVSFPAVLPLAPRDYIIPRQGFSREASYRKYVESLEMKGCLTNIQGEWWPMLSLIQRVLVWCENHEARLNLSSW